MGNRGVTAPYSAAGNYGGSAMVVSCHFKCAMVTLTKSANTIAQNSAWVSFSHTNNASFLGGVKMTQLFAQCGRFLYVHQLRTVSCTCNVCNFDIIILVFKFGGVQGF